MENVKEKAVVKEMAKEANSEKVVKKDYMELVGILSEFPIKDFRTGEDTTAPFVQIKNPFDKYGDSVLLRPTFVSNRGMWKIRARKEIAKAIEKGENPKIEIRVKMYLKSFYSEKAHREMAMLNFEIPNFTDDGHMLMSIVGKEDAAPYNQIAQDYLNPVK